MRKDTRFHAWVSSFLSELTLISSSFYCKQVTSQRQQYHEYVQGKPTPLTKQRKDLLDDIGFQWRIRNRPEWTTKFDELIKYKEKHGDTRVPQHYSDNRALGKWVAKQREQYKLLKKGKQ
jgi:Helicase associated domain